MSSPSPPKGRPLAPGRVDAARSGPRVPLFALVVAGLVVLLVAVAVTIRLVGDDESVTSDGGPAATSPAAGDRAFGPVTVDGDALPALADPDAAIGSPAPRLEGVTTAGDPLTVDPAEGPMVIAFVAHWCPHCQVEVPRLVELAGGSDEVDGVRIVAVATGSNPQAPEYPPGEWLAGEAWPGPVLVDTETATAATAYGVSGYPFLVAVDGEGIVVARSSGELGDDGLRAFVALVSPAP